MRKGVLGVGLIGGETLDRPSTCPGIGYPGLAGLSGVDASVMPDIPSANTHLPTIMIAEHVAIRFDI